MKEPTGNTEAELVYWQERALKAETEVRQLENDIVHLRNDVIYARGQLENETYNSTREDE